MTRALSLLRSVAARRIVVGAVVLLLAIAGVQIARGSGQVHVVAYFSDSTGIYAGDKVEVLGVPVGSVDSIKPGADGVRIAFHYSANIKVPDRAKAVIVAPSLVSGRYLQLTPQYTAGAVLRSGSTIPLNRTVTPVEWDQIKGELDQLSVALGPHGSNKDGALSRLVGTASGGLKGEGPTINTTLANLSKAITTLDSGSGDLFATIKNLAVFVQTVAQSNQTIRQFSANLDTVSSDLNDNRGNLRDALSELSGTVVNVRRFIRQNRSALTTTTTGLGDVMSTVAGAQTDLEQTLHTAPAAIKHLYAAYTSKTNSVNADLELKNIANVSEFACSAIASAALLPPSSALSTCQKVLGPLLNSLTGSTAGTSNLLNYLTNILGVKVP